MSITTMEEVFKAGWEAGKFSSLGETSDEAWETYRYEVLLKTSGKETADEWLKARHQPSQIQNLKCPDCQGEMVPRSSQYGKFWGCTNYPRCKGTRDSEGLSKAERQAERDMVKGPFLEPVDNREDVPVESGELYKFKKG